MPDDSIMDMVNNIEEMYSDKIALFEKWVDEGENWNRIRAEGEILALATHFAKSLEPVVDGHYTTYQTVNAAAEMMKEFKDFQEQEVEQRLKNATRKATPKDLLMDPGDVEHARKYEDLAKKVGIEKILPLIPVSSAKVRQALERGDKHLNSISLRKWDQAALNLSLRERGLSLSEGVCVLKHVAKWHYA